MRNSPTKTQIIMVLSILLIAYVWTRSNPSANYILPLQAPAVKAQSSSFLEREAGISAYVNANRAINLTQVKDVFRTLEVQTSDYLIGSVPVSNYDETEDVHAYVHKDGWILVYYLANDPLSKIIDWRAYNTTAIPTKLEQALGTLASRVGVGTTNIAFYDFRFPTATHLMLAGKSNGSFQVKLPDGFEYYQMGWSIAFDARNPYDWSPSQATFAIDNVKLQTLDGTGKILWKNVYSTLSPGQLLPGVYHTITADNGGVATVTSFAGVAVIYKEQ